MSSLGAFIHALLSRAYLLTLALARLSYELCHNYDFAVCTLPRQQTKCTTILHGDNSWRLCALKSISSSFNTRCRHSYDNDTCFSAGAALWPTCRIFIPMHSHADDIFWWWSCFEFLSIGWNGTSGIWNCSRQICETISSVLVLKRSMADYWNDCSRKLHKLF